MTRFLTVVSRKQDVKTVKTCLENSSLINRDLKISRLHSPERAGDNGELFAIPTVLVIRTNNTSGVAEVPDDESKHQILHACEEKLSPAVLSSLTFATVDGSTPPDLGLPRSANPLHNAVKATLRKLNAKFTVEKLPDIEESPFQLPRAYSVYQPLLLLPPDAIDSETWKALFDTSSRLNKTAEDFFSTLASEMHVTHIAIDAPIPSHSSSSVDAHEALEENFVRSPQNLKPLYGNFGPICPAFPRYNPTKSDFDEAFWVSTRQNGIAQIWAPLYTMFSSGNVTEKARMLQLTSVRDAVRIGIDDGRGSAAVDLFAGIGYFAFSYAKAGISKVLCWDLNPWSIEGLQRGARANKWQVSKFDVDPAEGSDHDADSMRNACKGPEKFIVFSETNANAGARIKQMRSFLPPIRHVNCGMLPSASPVWQTAVEAIDHRLGGWIHLHETVFENLLEDRSRFIAVEVQKHLKFMRGRLNCDKVALEHIEKVKSIGPRILHVVLDIWIPPDSSIASVR